MEDGFAFSIILISVGQLLPILKFLERDSVIRENGRAAKAVPAFAFLLVHMAVQGGLHAYVTGAGWGSLPTLLCVFVTVAYFLLFVRLFTGVALRSCLFASLIFLLVDNSVWPLLSMISRQLFGGVNYLYDGPYLYRLPFIAALWILEYGLMALIRRLLPPLRKIRIDLYNGVLLASSMIPFLYIRLYLALWTTQNNKSVQIIMTICCLVSLVTLVGGIGRSSEEMARFRTAQMHYILEMQQAQFKEQLADIDEVNRKYHDMKNMLLYLRAQEGSPGLDEQIGELLDELKPYESDLHTGNVAIDVVMNEKLKLCCEKGISCVPYLDGSLFEMVDELDLCTIFGNAMDNAIESCEQLEKPQDRQISIRSVSQGGTVVLTFRNTFAVRPDLRGGLPVTTKSDAANHGYGLRNMRYIMEKYGGQLNCRVEGQEFVLTLLFLMKD